MNALARRRQREARNLRRTVTVAAKYGAAARDRPATAAARGPRSSAGEDSIVSTRTRIAVAQRTTATETEETSAVYVHTHTSRVP